MNPIYIKSISSTHGEKKKDLHSSLLHISGICNYRHVDDLISLHCNEVHSYLIGRGNNYLTIIQRVNVVNMQWHKINIISHRFKMLLIVKGEFKWVQSPFRQLILNAELVIGYRFYMN